MAAGALTGLYGARLAMRCAKRYAFVLPRFGENVFGGAETLAGTLAQCLARRGDQVEVFTTCAKDNRTWENAHSAGVTSEYGVTVSRFPVDKRDLERWIPLQIRISEGMRLDIDEQLDWMAESVNSTGLYEHIRDSAQRFDAIFFAPYLFGTTFWGSQIAPERSFLIPCLHDEHYAYLDVIQSMFRQVRGAIFNALPEREFAVGLYGHIAGGDVGMGFVPYETTDLEPFFKEEFPYLLYFGRRETGKNVHTLIDHFIAAKDAGWISREIKLVVAGGGSFSDLHRDRALERSDIVNVDAVSEMGKRQLMRHAIALNLPSVNESFSIVIMESWMLGVPVIVHSGCAVTRHHVTESGGGLYFASPEDLAAATMEIYKNRELRAEMGRAGDRYVREVYNWDAVVERFDRVMAEFN